MRTDDVIVQITKAAKRCGAIKKIILFGSRARGDNTDTRDYDIAVAAASLSRSFIISKARSR